MAVFKADSKTKDGRQWVFFTRYKDLKGNTKPKKSKKFLTKKEAMDAERKFILNYNSTESINKIKFKDLFHLYCEFQKNRVKESTYEKYLDRYEQLKELENINMSEFSIFHFNQWRKNIESEDFKLSYKNTLYKQLKAILNYGIKQLDFDISNVTAKMEVFKEPDKIDDIMKFWNYKEFKTFILVEEDITYNTFFEFLYYLGVREGEAKAIKWSDINFNTRRVRINKNVVKLKGKYILSSPKNKSSNRNLKMPMSLVNSLKKLYEYSKTLYGFNDDYFVFGGFKPLSNSTIDSRKNKACKLAGVQQIKIHEFRHSCASLLISKGASPVLVAEYLGHANPYETLKIYSHMFESEVDKITAMIDSMEDSEKENLATIKVSYGINGYNIEIENDALDDECFTEGKTNQMLKKIEDWLIKYKKNINAK